MNTMLIRSGSGESDFSNRGILYTTWGGFYPSNRWAKCRYESKESITLFQKGKGLFLNKKGGRRDRFGRKPVFMQDFLFALGTPMEPYIWSLRVKT